MSLQVRGVVKSYGGVRVLDRVDLAVADGEIHALLGANGAGKSTLIKCISGAVTPDEGEIVLGDRAYTELTPRAARGAGVAVIYQELSLAPSLTAAENIFLGQELRAGPFVRRRRQRREARRLLSTITDAIGPRDVVESLPRSGQQIVEIVKALRSEPEILILDEPTAALTHVEAEILARRLGTLRDRGVPIIYVTHRLPEVFAVADSVTVLRDGSTVLSAPVGEVTMEDLVNAIAGKAGAEARPRRGEAIADDVAPVLVAEEISARGIGPVSLEVDHGEIVGVFGLLGSGRTELVEAVAGVRPLRSGNLFLDGTSVRFRRPVEAIANGIVLVPSERLRKSLFSPLTSVENVVLPGLRKLARGPFRSRRRERSAFSRIATLLDVQPRNPTMLARNLSGGNQQKLVVGRWLREEQPVEVLLLDEPTEGVDVGARADLYSVLQAVAAERRCGILFTSSDSGELVTIADRVLVLADGRIVGDVSGDELTERRLLQLVHVEFGERALASSQHER
jgi:ribose transport system ATP-binding protein